MSEDFAAGAVAGMLFFFLLLMILRTGGLDVVLFCLWVLVG